MTDHSVVSNMLARRYVTALLDAALPQPGLVVLRDQLRQLQSMISGSIDFSYMLSSPLLSVADQQRAVAALLDRAQMHKTIVGFVQVTLKNRRGKDLPLFIKAALEEIDRRDGLARADVTVAAPLSEGHQQKLAAMLSAWTGARVGLNVIVSPEVLGGIKIRLGSIQIDDSISGKLDRLQQALRSGQLI